MKIFAALIVTLMMIFVASCKLESPGTNTGNPDEPQLGSPGSNFTAYKLAASACLKIDECDSQPLMSTCFAQVTQLQGYTQELGTTAGNYTNIQDLANAERASEVTANNTNYDNCAVAIQNLSCTDPLVQSAYTSADPTNFTNTNLLFRASTNCTQVY